MNRNPSCKFQLRVYVGLSGVDRLECWVHELGPTDTNRRYSDEWVREHFEIYDREFWVDSFKELDWTKPQQILCTGEVNSEYDYWGEYDEDHTFDEKFESMAYSEDWFIKKLDISEISQDDSL